MNAADLKLPFQGRQTMHVVAALLMVPAATIAPQAVADQPVHSTDWPTYHPVKSLASGTTIARYAPEFKTNPSIDPHKVYVDRLKSIRRRIVASGRPLMSWEEIDTLVASRRKDR